MRILIILAVLISSTAFSQPALGILKDTTIQGPIKQIEEVQSYGKSPDSVAFKYRYTFDAQGNVIREEQWENSDFLVRWNCEYDDQGNLIEHLRESEFQEVDKDSFAYDDQNNLIYEAQDIGGPFPKTWVFQYDESGNKIREERYVSGNHKGTYYYHYEGENVVRVEWQFNDAKRDIEWNIYDKDGRIVKSTQLNIRRNEVKDTCEVIYKYPNTNERVIEDGCKSKIKKIVVNDQGQVIYEEKIRKGRRGKTRTIIQREYNTQGQVTLKKYKILKEDGGEDYSSTTFYEYEYDKYDNWTKLEWFEEKEGVKELGMRFKRVISYSK